MNMNSRLKTLVVIDNLYTGGVATSLYNFLYFTHERMDIHLLVFDEESIDITKIPEDIKIVTPSKYLHILGKNHSKIKQESRFLMFCRLLMIFIAKIKNGVVSRKLLWPFVEKVQGYDLAIAYAQDDSYKSISKGCIDFVVKKVEASHKSVIVHCDYKNFGGFNNRQINMFDKLNTVICVSESCKNSFVECFPELSCKTIVCENFTKVESVRKLAKNGICYPRDTVNFVSVCRLSEEKGLYRTVKVFAELYKIGVENFTWTIVGDGPEYERLKKIIDEEQLGSKINIVGNKNNPYIYIINASCFLLPSFHEAAPMVFGEASSLGVPILSTETCSALELVQDRKIGLVVPNSFDGLLNGIREFITNPQCISIDTMSELELNKNALAQLEKYVRLIKAATNV